MFNQTDNLVLDAPQSQKIRPDLRMRSAKSAGFRLVRRNLVIPRKGRDVMVFIRRVRDDHDLADVMEEAGQESLVAIVMRQPVHLGKTPRGESDPQSCGPKILMAAPSWPGCSCKR